MRKIATLAVTGIAMFGLVACVSEPHQAVKNTTEVTTKPADRVPEMYKEGSATVFKQTHVHRYTLKTSDGRLVDCFVNRDGYAGGLSCIPLETEEGKPTTEKQATGHDDHK